MTCRTWWTISKRGLKRIDIHTSADRMSRVCVTAAVWIEANSGTFAPTRRKWLAAREKLQRQWPEGRALVASWAAKTKSLLREISHLWGRKDPKHYCGSSGAMTCFFFNLRRQGLVFFWGRSMDAGNCWVEQANKKTPRKAGRWWFCGGIDRAQHFAPCFSLSGLVWLSAVASGSPTKAQAKNPPVVIAFTWSAVKLPPTVASKTPFA